MKDLPLSLLSRGCGQFISSNKGRQDGRVDVCFTPQDYYIWKSRDSLLRLSKSGCLLTGEEPTLPKTYTTRRGPLILYSQDLVTLKTCDSEAADGKQQVVRQYNPQGKQQLSTMKELTSTNLNYNTHLLTSSRLVPPLCPPYRHLPPPPVLCGPNPLSFHNIQQQLRTGMRVHVKPQWRNTEQENPPEAFSFPVDQEVKPEGRNRIRLNLFLQIPTPSRTPTPQMEPQPWIQHGASTSEEPGDTEEIQPHLNRSQQLGEHLLDSEIQHQCSAGELHHSDNVHDDQYCFTQRDSETSGDKEGRHGRSISRCRPERIVCGSQQQSTTASETTPADMFLPPIRAPPSVYYRDSREQMGKVSRCSLSSDEQLTQRMPPIADKPTDGHKTQTQYDTKVQKTGFRSIKSTTVGVHQQPLHLPLLFPEKTEDVGQKQRRMREKTERQNCKQEAGDQKGGGGGLPPERGFNIFLDPGEDPPVPEGVLGSVTARRGPGRRSSMAFLQNRLLNLQDGSEPSETSRGLVKGVLPLELRDLQNGKLVGSLIMGPDGEIIQLSLYDNIQDQPQGDGDTPEQALQVLSPKGETLPWVILLQPEPTHTELEGEQNPDLPVDAPSTSLLHREELHRSAETDPGSPKNPSDPVQGAEKLYLSQGATMRKKRKNPKMDAENNNSVSSRSDEKMNVDPRKGDSKAKAEEEERPMKGHLSESQKGDKVTHEGDVTLKQQRNISTEAITEDTVNTREKNVKRRDSQEAAAIREKRGMKGVTVNSAGKKAFRKKMEEDQQTQKIKVTDAPPIRRQDQEDKENKEAVETQASKAPPAMVQTLKSEDGRTGDVKMTENGNEGGEGAELEKSLAGRGRRRSKRGRLKHKELVFGNPENFIEKEELGINQQTQEFHPNPTSGPPAQQKHSQSTDVNSTKENRGNFSINDAASNGDKHSRSVSSLRSAAAASCVLQSSSQRSLGSSSEGPQPCGSVGPSLPCSRLSSCSTVMITEEKLMLNPLKPELMRNEEEEAAILRKERRRHEVERRWKEMEEERRKEMEEKRREMEEERRQQEKEQMEEKIKNELEEERRRRAEEQRLKKQAENGERKRREEDEQKEERRQQERREREKRRQEEKRRQMEIFQKMREEEEQRRTVEQERLRLEEEGRQEEENQKLQAMEEGERIEYLRQKEQEEEDRRRKEEERRQRVEEEVLLAAQKARVEEELLARQMALLQQKLSFGRGLQLEATGLEMTQGVSRPWTYSYFTLLQLLGLNPTKEHDT